MRLSLSLAVCLLSVFFLLTLPAQAANYTVTTAEDTNDGVCGAHCSLREAIAAASGAAGNDTIDFAAFLSDTITLTRGEIAFQAAYFNKTITVNGRGAKNFSISGGGGRVFRVGPFSNLTLNDLTVKNGAGGNIHVNGILVLNRVVVTGSTGGPGLFLENGRAEINESALHGNSALPAGDGGAIYAVDAGLTIENSTFYDNRAKAFGGAVAARRSSVDIFSSTFTANEAERGGGLYYEPGNNQSLTLGNNIVALNNAAIDAATRDLYVWQASIGSSSHNLVGDARGATGWTATDVLNRDPLFGAFGDYGGPTPTVPVAAGSPAIDAGAAGVGALDQRGYPRRVDGDGNRVDADDIGAFEVQPAPLVVTNAAGDTDRTCDSHCTLKDAMYVGSRRRGLNRIVFGLPAGARTITLVDDPSFGVDANPVVVDGANAVTLTGGGSPLLSLAAGGRVTLMNLTLSGGGDGIANSGELVLENVRVTGMTGSGLRNLPGGTATVRGSLFDANLGSANGAALYNGGTAYLENTTVVNNAGGNGGGIANRGALTIQSCTIAYNRAEVFSNSQGGGIDGRGGTTVVANTIIYGNTAGFGPDVSGAFASQGYNIVGSTASGTGFGAAGDLVNPAGGAGLPTTTASVGGQTKTIAALAANGGALPSVALLPASPAVDAADPRGRLTADQRGFFRAADGNGDGTPRADVGAFERVPSPDLQGASDSGASAVDNLTNDLTPTFDVAGVASGALVALYRDNTAVAAATSAGGLVSLTDPNAPAAGAAAYQARITYGGATDVSASLTVSFDTARPTATINQAAGQADPSNEQPVRYGIVFSENVSGLSGAGVVLSGTANVAGAAKNVSGAGAAYTLEVSRVATDGTVTASLAAGAATDAAGNGSFASTSTDNTITVAGDAFDSFVVTRADDAGTPGACDADCTLREALAAADASRGAETITFSPSVFDGARTIVVGAELAFNSDVTIAGTGLGNLTLSGGGGRVARIAAGANVFIGELTIKNGAAIEPSPEGGAIYNAGSLTLAGVAVTDSTASVAGGAIYNVGTLRIDRGTVAGNAAASETNSASGGGIYQAAGSLTITDSTVSGNSAAASGGGLYIASGTVRIVNSTLAGNSVTGTNFFSGGALYLVGGTVEMTSATIALNTAPAGGGGLTYIGTTAGALRFRNTIVAANSGLNVQSPGGVVTSHGNNLFGTTAGIRSGTLFQSSDKLNVDARLGPFGDHGGPTKTVSLLADSPAINAGSDCVVDLSCAAANPPAALLKDQRGASFARKSGASADIGAFEFVIVPTAGRVTAGGRVVDAGGRGIARAVVTMTDAGGGTRAALTNHFGYYRFSGVAAGATYLFAVRAKGLTFQTAAQARSVTDETDDIIFIGQRR